MPIECKERERDERQEAALAAGANTQCILEGDLVGERSPFFEDGGVRSVAVCTV